jgi:hypothetical protein
LSIVGCSKPPATVVDRRLSSHKAEEQSPNPPSTPAAGWLNSPNPNSSPPALTSTSTPSQEIAFSNPVANQAWNQYVDSFESVRSVPAPPVLSEPSAIAAHIDEINRRLAILQQSRAVLMSSLTSPEDQKRFRTAEQSLSESQQ